MVLGVEEHVVGCERFDPASNRARHNLARVAIMVHGPYCKEGGQALAYCHGKDVILQPANVKYREDDRNPESVRAEFGKDPDALARSTDLDGFAMKADGKEWTYQDRLPPRQASAHRLKVLVVHAITMVTQMVYLNCMHRSEHSDAQAKHDAVRASAGEAERIVVGVVGLAQPGQEKQERASQRWPILTSGSDDPRCDQPRKRKGQFFPNVERTQTKQVGPTHGDVVIHWRDSGRAGGSAQRQASGAHGSGRSLPQCVPCKRQFG